MEDINADDYDMKYQQLVQTSLAMIQVLTDMYGNERAIECWESLAGIADELRGDVWTEMLLGNNAGTIIIPQVARYSNKVSVIKAIRRVSDMGLKEAKLLSEEVLLRRVSVPIVNMSRLEALTHLRESGLPV